MNPFPKWYWYSAWVVIAIAYIAGLFIDIMDIDAAQYAAIAKEMFLNHSYLEVYLRGHDYLDKPPLLFWLSVLSFNIFGIHDWAFRLPSLLVTILGVYSSYRFTKLFYPESTARLAALIIASCQAFFLMNHDVRTDSLLTGFVSFTFWQMAAFDKTNKLKHILLVGVGIGFAMLSKGPIGLVVPGTAFLFHYILNRDWKKILRWQYLPALLVMAVVLFPMSYGLYMQYDLHPEKVVYDLQGPSGLRFFYWTQSFGRITGEIYWNNHPDTFFLVHNFLWSFLPWSLLFIVAYFIELKGKIKQLIQKESNIEWITTTGFLLILIFLSMSNYQLPHYSFVIHPLAAIILAVFLDTRLVNRPGLRWAMLILFLLTIVCLLGVGIFMFGVFFSKYLVLSFILIISTLVFSISIFFNKKIQFSSRLVFAGVFFISTTNIVLNAITYPQLLSYQADSAMAKYVNLQSPDAINTKIIYYKTSYLYSADFYANAKVSSEGKLINLQQQIVPGKTWVVTDSLHISELRRALAPKSERIFKDFHVSTLKIGFLNPETRDKAVEIKYLLNY